MGHTDGTNIKIFYMNGLDIAQDRMVKRPGLDQKTINHYLGKMLVLANSLNASNRRSIHGSKLPFSNPTIIGQTHFIQDGCDNYRAF